MKRLKLAAYAIAAIGLVASPAMADVIIFDNGVPDLFGAHTCDAAGPYEMAGDFVLAPGGNVVTGINWWGAYSPSNTPGDDFFTVYLYTSAGGVPTPTSFMEIVVGDANRTGTGQTVWGTSEVYSYSADIAPLTLTAGETYYLSVVNDTAADADDEWLWVTSGVFIGDFVPGRDGVDNGSPWGYVNPVPAELAFNLTGRGATGGVVPEPASALLFGCGLIGFAARRLRCR